MLHRRRVGRVDGDIRRGQRRLDIAFVGVGGVVRIDLFGFVEIVAVGGERRVMRLRLVRDADERRGVPGDFRRLRDDGADELAAEMDAAVRRGAFRGVITATTPASASASAVSIAVILPRAMAASRG